MTKTQRLGMILFILGLFLKLSIDNLTIGQIEWQASLLCILLGIWLFIRN